MWGYLQKTYFMPTWWNGVLVMILGVNTQISKPDYLSKISKPLTPDFSFFTVRFPVYHKSPVTPWSLFTRYEKGSLVHDRVFPVSTLNVEHFSWS